MPYVRKLEESWIGIELELYNKIGALNAVTNKLSNLGMNIEYLETTEITDIIYRLFMIMSSESSIDYQIIKEELEASKEFVKSVSLAPQYDAIIYSSKHYLKYLGGSRVIFMEQGAMNGFIKGIKDALGKEAGSHLLYHIGHGVGRSLYDKFISIAKVKDLETLIIGLTALYHGLGWGMIDKVDLFEDGFDISIIDNWECHIYNNESHSHEGFFTKGVFAGIVSKHTSKKVAVVEDTCIAKGDAICKFKVRILA